MKLTPIVDRLKACGFTRVYGALEFMGLEKQPAVLPAYFVLPEQWSAKPNDRIGVHDQALTERFGIVTMLDGRGLDEARVSDELEDREEAILEALAGWRHPDASRACQAVGGKLLSTSGRTLSWLTSFSTSRHIRISTSRRAT